MTSATELADFAVGLDYADLSSDVVDELEKRLLDTVGIAIGAMGERPPELVRRTVTAHGRDGPCRLWGTDVDAHPTGATMYNTTLSRYLDFMDSYLAPGETPHPSDNVAATVACCQLSGATGRELLEAMAVAYEIQGALAWAAPVRDRGFDHVTHTVISAAAGAGKALGLDADELRHAIAIAGTGHNALRVTRTEGINMWKGLASANAARNAVYAVSLANNGIEGPLEFFDGQKGWKQVVAGGDFEVDLTPGERVFDVMTKRFVAETYAQSAVEGIIELAESEDIEPDDVLSINLDTFAGAKLIIGGGEGSRYRVERKAQADHSLPYMLAVALIDREMTNAQYERDRIRADDVQRLVREVTVSADDDLTERFERGEMPCVVDVTMADGTTYRIEKEDFEGHPNRPMSWDGIEEKFETMAEGRYDAARREAIVEAIKTIEGVDVSELVSLLD